MYIFRTITRIAFLILFSLIWGCGTAYKPLSLEQSRNIRRIGVHVQSPNSEMTVINHTGPAPTTIVGGQFGALGALLEGLIIQMEITKSMSSSLRGDPKTLSSQIAHLDLTTSLKTNILQTLEKKYAVVDISHIKTPQKNPSALRELNVDTLLEVGFVYGLATYTGEAASPAIVADIKITDLKQNINLITKRISSDAYFRNNRPVAELAKNNAQQFQEDISRASRIIAVLVASEFLVDTIEVPPEPIFSAMNFGHANCSRPYRLTHDCSFLNGATRTIQLEGVEAKIAGSDDGKIVLVMSGSHMLNSIKDGLTLGMASFRGSPSQRCLKAVSKKLKANQIQILQRIKLVSYGSIDGFLLKLDKDGYSLLKAHSI